MRSRWSRLGSAIPHPNRGGQQVLTRLGHIVPTRLGCSTVTGNVPPLPSRRAGRVPGRAPNNSKKPAAASSENARSSACPSSSKTPPFWTTSSTSSPSASTTAKTASSAPTHPPAGQVTNQARSPQRARQPGKHRQNRPADLDRLGAGGARPARPAWFAIRILLAVAVPVVAYLLQPA